MEELITCNICFEDKNTNITLEHINPTGDVTGHQMCNDCYKSMRVNCCPFCRCKIVIPEISKIEINNSDLMSNNDLMTRFPNLLNHRDPYANRNYNIIRMRLGLANGGYSN
jgi:hypothetical protein